LERDPVRYSNDRIPREGGVLAVSTPHRLPREAGRLAPTSAKTAPSAAREGLRAHVVTDVHGRDERAPLHNRAADLQAHHKGIDDIATVGAVALDDVA